MHTRIALLLLALPALSFGQQLRTVDATFVATMSEPPAGAQKIEVWVPLPRNTPAQTIENLVVDSRYRWQWHKEKEFGNEYLFAVIENPREGMDLVRLRFRVTRREITPDNIPAVTPSKRELQRNLRADRLVTLSPRIQSLAEEVTRGKTSQMEQARAIYDYVLLTMVYDKTKPGWGQGDTERACDIRAGNCTDFHSLFMSLARAKGIPARFIIGFPIAGTSTSGYHCWAEFYLPGKGWIPVDPSDASKSTDPVRREYLFGNLDPNRMEFTTGRDIKLSPPTRKPLNLFIYPHVEANRQEIERPAILITYHDVAPAMQTGITESGAPASAGGSDGAEAGIDVATMRLIEVSKAGSDQP